MKHTTLNSSSKNQLAELFYSAFSASEGEEEGQLISKLAYDLAELIDHKSVFCFASFEQDKLAGAIFFSPLNYNQDIDVSMLAPVAVSPDYQRKGVGSALIRYGLEMLKSKGIEIAITYGDPAYYSKFGFEPLSEEFLKAPMPLSMPFGWQGQSLKGEAISVIEQRPTCVSPFNDPKMW